MRQHWSSLNLTTKMLSITVVTILAAMAGLGGWLSSQMRADVLNLVRSRSIVIQRQIEVSRAYIAGEYVAKIKAAAEGKVKIAQDHSAPDTVPFPATATREMAETLSREGIYNARVISETPLNPANKPSPGFEETAIKALAAGDKEASTVELVNGVPTFRRMTPDIIQNQACLSCHTGKKMGEMVGAVSVSIPLTSALARVEHNVDILYGVGAFVSLLMALALYIGLRSQVIQPIRKLQTVVHSLAQGDLSARSPVTTQDEVGKLAQAFNQMGDSLQRTSAKQQELVSTLNNAQANLLICDRNLNITYANKGAVTTVRLLADKFRQAMPTFDDANFVGSRAGMFVNDGHSLTDPRTLPVRYDVQIGSVTLDVTIDALHSPAGEYIGNTIEWVDVTEKRGAEKTILRMRAALENAGINFMIADEQENIIFLNKAAYSTLKRLEADLRTYLPGFEADKVVGGSIHRYHKDPQAIKHILAGLKPGEARRGEITPGPFIFEHETRAIFDEKGHKIAYVVQWRDVTNERTTQMNLERIITRARNGQLSDRLDTGGLEGTCQRVSVAMNQFLDAVVSPLREALTVLAALAAGDLTKQMTGDYAGDFDQIKTSLNAAVQNLARILAIVREAAEAVTNGSEEISKGSEDLSQRTSQQASAIQETSASMEEMTSTVKQNADNAKQANQLAIAARDIAERGGSVTARAVQAMDEINKSSKKIADIITVIDEIAFQTNLLALNAAVEAARAGEHGRGFAVVASEVRNLAQRSATAAKEIKGLINESIQRVTDGSELVNQSGKTLDEIVTAVKRVTDIIAEISVASQQQASGIDMVNKAIAQMDEGTQQNAALVEETTAASQTMREQAKELMRQVAAFKVTGTTGSGTAGPKGPQGAAPQRPLTPSPLQTPHGDRPDASRRSGPVPGKGVSPEVRQPVGVPAGNGHDRRAKGDEFEEF